MVLKNKILWGVLGVVVIVCVLQEKAFSLTHPLSGILINNASESSLISQTNQAYAASLQQNTQQQQTFSSFNKTTNAEANQLIALSSKKNIHQKTFSDSDLPVSNKFTSLNTISTSAAATITSSASSGNWSNPTSWSGGVVPGASDDVVIAAGTTILVDANTTCQSITIESGGILQIANSITLTLTGDWTNSGSFDAGTSGIVELTGSTSSTISGTTAFEELIISKDNLSIPITITDDVTVSSGGNLTLTGGLIQVNSGASLNLNYSNQLTIPATAGFEVNGGTLETGNFSINNKGLIRINSGTANFGASSGNSIETNTDGVFEVASGVVNIAGRLRNSAGGTLTPPNIPSGINISGGTINLATEGNGASSEGTLHVTQQGAFSFTGGTIVFKNASTASTALDLSLAEEDGNGTKTTTGGTFQFGESTSTNSTFIVNSLIPLYNIQLPGSNQTIVFEDVSAINNFTQLSLNSNNIELPVLPGGTYNLPIIEGTNQLPVTIQITGGTGVGTLTFSAESAKAPENNNTSSASYLNRHWTIDITGLSGSFSYAVIADFLPAEINGSSANLVSGVYDNTSWNIHDNGSGSINTTTHTLSASGITAPSIILTAINQAPTIVIDNGESTAICEGSSVNLTTTATGDPTLNYAWTSTSAGFTASTADISVTPNTTTNYKVTVTDGNGFTASDAIDVVVNTEPTITNCPSSPIETTLSSGDCSADVTYNILASGDPSPSYSYTFSGATTDSGTGTGSGMSFNLGTTYVTVSASNSCGNADCSFEVIVLDEEDPVFSNCPANIVVNTSPGECEAEVAWFPPTATDNCTPTSNLNWTKSHDPGNTFPHGETTVVYTVEDSGGNTTTCSFTINVEDKEAPQKDICPVTITADASSGQCGAIVNYTLPTFKDNCDGNGLTGTLTGGLASGQFFPVGTTTVTYSYTDLSGNGPVECSFDVIVTDRQKPTFTCPPTISGVPNDPGKCFATGIDLGSPTVTDNCDPAPTITNDAPSQFPIGTTTVIWTATDSNNNKSTCTQSVVVVDNEKPTANPLSAIGPFSCIATIPEPDIDLITGETDNCGTVTVSHFTDSGSPSCSGTITRTYRITDQYGNFNDITQAISVDDQTPPTADAIPELTVECYDDIPAPNINLITGEIDNCGGIVTVSYITTDSDPGVCPATISRTYRLTDPCGNSSDITQSINIEDTTSPIIAGVPADVMVNCDNIPPVASPTATDNCNSPPDITFSEISTKTDNGSCTDFSYTITRTWTAEDLCGNKSSKSQTITVQDITKPTITLQATVSIECSDNDDPSNTGYPTVNDNCDPNPTISFSDSPIVPSTCASQYSFTRTWTVTDACGNTTTQQQIIAVSDNTPPQLTCPSDITVATPDDIPHADLSSITATDNCSSSENITIQFIDEDYTGLDDQPGFCPTSIIRTFQATDECGNKSTCTQTITVSDVSDCAACVDEVPFFLVDMTGNPDSIVTIEDVLRSNKCCNTGGPSTHCASFNIRLDPGAVGLEILVDGVIPPGQDWRQDCGNLDVHGGIVCIDPGVFHLFTYCKAGNGTDQRTNSYTFRSVKGLEPETLTTRINCQQEITVSGAIPGTLNWTDITSTDGRYLDYLSCTDGCGETNHFLPDENSPSVVRYRVCGEVEDNLCSSNRETCTIVEVNVRPEILIDIVGAPVFCEDNPTTLEAVITPAATYEVEWFYGTDTSGAPTGTGFNFTPTQSGEYTIVATEYQSGLECNSTSQTFNIQINPLPIFDLGDDTSFCLDDDNLSISLPTGSTYTWSPAAGVTAISATEFAISPDQTTTYTVTATSPEGCKFTDTWTVNVYDCIPTCAIATVCPSGDLDINTVQDFLDTGGVIDYPCNVPLTSTTNISLLNESTDNQSCPETITRTYQITDDCGNKAQCDMLLIRTDTEAPQINCPTSPANYLSCSLTNLESLTGLALAKTSTPISLAQLTSAGGSASDNCGILSISYIDVASGSCPTTIQRTFTVTDFCDNQNQCSQTITVDDNSEPELICPTPITENACGISDLVTLTGLAYSETIVKITEEDLITAGGTITDACGVREITYRDNQSGACPIIIERLFNVTDSCGNGSSCTQTITLTDNSQPTISCPTGLTYECIGDIPPIWNTVAEFEAAGGTISDACGIDESSFSLVSENLSNGSCPLTLERVYSISDYCDNTQTCTFTVSIEDNEPPVLHDIPADESFECSDCIQSFQNADFELNPLSSSENWRYIDQDLVPGWSTTSPTDHIEIQRSGKINGVISHSGNFHAELNADRDADFYQEFCTVPTTYVQISFWHRWRPPLSINSSDDKMGVYIGPDRNNLSLATTVTAPRNVHSSYWEQHVISFPVPSGQTSTVFLFRAIQGAPSNNTYGNLIDDINVVTLFDASAIPYATDNCQAGIDLHEQRIEGTCPGNYQLIRTWTATDICGNKSSASQTVTVGDFEPPLLIGVPNDTTVNCHSIPVPPTVTASDNCSVNLTPTFNETQNGSGCNYTIERTWTVKDDCNYITSETQIITVVDTVAPEFTYCPSDVDNVPANPDNCSVDSYSLDTPIAIDNCASSPTITWEKTGATTGTGTGVASGLFNVGTTTITYTASDGCGNTASCTQNVTIIDTQDPMIIDCPDDITVSAPASVCDLLVQTIDPIQADDNCDPNDLVLTWEKTGATTGNGSGEVNNTHFEIGVTHVTYTVTDPHNNSVSCSFDVTVKRLEIPPTVVNCPSNPADTYAEDEACTAFVVVPAPTVNDPCDAIESITHDSNYSTNTDNANGDYPVGEHTITWTITDRGGTFTTCQQTFDVIDDQDPTITCPKSTDPAEPDLFEEFISGDGCDWAPTNVPNPTYADNCGVVAVTYELSGATTGSSQATGFNYVSDASLNVGITIVTYTSWDAAGNASAPCSIRIWIKNLNDPQFDVTCPNQTSITQDADDGSCFTEVTIPGPSINNVCAEEYSASYQIDLEDPVAISLPTTIAGSTTLDDLTEILEVGTHTITWTITDASGNVTNCEQTVTVNDLLPQLECPNDTVVQAEYDKTYNSNVSLDPPTWGDNCPDPVLTWELVPPTGYETQYDVSELTGTGVYPNPNLFYLGTTRITYTVTDTNENTKNCSFTVTVLGAPEITCADDITRTTDADVCSATFDPGIPTLNTGTPPISWTWTITNPDGTTQTGSSTGNAPDPSPTPIGNYEFQLGITTITWRAQNVSGFDECTQTITITDGQEPVITSLNPIEECVEALSEAIYYPPTIDINPTRPDYFLFEAGSTSLDLDLTTVTDNCAPDCDYSVRWQIDFSPTPDPIPPHNMITQPSLTGTGQLSTYTSDIKFPGDGVNFTNIVHTITYWVEDCNGNESAPKQTTITITPRPNIIKMN